MTVVIPDTGEASAEAIAAVVKRYGALPPDYIAFASKHNGAYAPGNQVKDTNGDASVRQFVPVEDIIRTAKVTEGFPRHLMPIAEDGCGNLLCIETKTRKIRFWDHENDDTNIIASSFSDLLLRLEPFSEADVQLYPGQVISSWVKPGFKPEF